MKKKKVNPNRIFRQIIFLFISFSLLFTLSAGVKYSSNPNEWKAPPEADKLMNHLKGNAAATEAGKKIFNIYCNSCHGNTGKGNGPAGAGLTPKPVNFTLEKVQEQTDGAIFWKLTNGRPPMPAYKDILKEEQRWQVVNYIRELGKPQVAGQVPIKKNKIKN